MKHLARTLALIILLSSACDITFAQKRKKSAVKAITAASFKPQTETADSLINEYRFDKAVSLLESDIEKSKEFGLPVSGLQRLLARAVLGSNMLEVVEKVIIVDSIVVDYNNMLEAILLDSSCGQLLTAQQIRHHTGIKQNPVGFGFLNDFCDQALFCQSGKGGMVSLVGINKFGDNWSTPAPLDGLVDSTAVRGYPFLMPDGTTLYFASKDSASLGGYDIYLTRYDSESKSFLKPQNIGMPFNSPFNDYLMAYDEVNGLGWFVSDRYQPKGKVCIYVFIPNQTRLTYTDVDTKTLIQFASLRNSGLTRKGHESPVADARLRLKNAKNKNKPIANDKAFSFDVAYGIRYNDIAQFKNEQARKLAAELQQLNEQYEKLTVLLKENRNKYRASNSPVEKKAIAPIIQRQEEESEVLYHEISELSNRIRKAENQE